MKIINGWIFCNRYLSSGKLVACAIPLDIVHEIVEYHNGHTAIVMDFDGQMVETDVNIIDALGTLQKYLLDHEEK